MWWFNKLNTLLIWSQGLYYCWDFVNVHWYSWIMSQNGVNCLLNSQLCSTSRVLLWIGVFKRIVAIWVEVKHIQMSLWRNSKFESNITPIVVLSFHIIQCWTYRRYEVSYNLIRELSSKLRFLQNTNCKTRRYFVFKDDDIVKIIMI